MVSSCSSRCCRGIHPDDHNPSCTAQPEDPARERRQSLKPLQQPVPGYLDKFSAENQDIIRLLLEAYRSHDIDELTHSVPYLTQPAKDLLDDIGLMFRQKVDEKGLESCKIIVTSLLRTKADVARLQQVNANATSNSTHCYATTFDITYQRFRLTGLIGGTTYSEQLVEALAEVLQQLREKGRCYVRFERNQHCFHITSRD